MLDVTGKTCRSIILVGDEHKNLKKELEQMFIDSNGTVENFYSLEKVTKKYPAIAELFRIL